MKRMSILLVLILLFTTALSACGGGTVTENGNETSEGNNSSVTVTGSGGDTTSTDESPVYGGSVVVGITQDLDSLDPHKTVSAGTREVFYNVYEGLVKPDKDGNLVPAVASSYTVSEDQSMYTFILRDGVKFHDGSLVNAGDVIYSLKRCAGLLETSDPEVSVQSAFSIISDIYETTVDGKAAVVVQLSKPNSELISHMTTAIIPEGYVTADGAPPGTGPFKFKSYSPLQDYVIEKNEEYYVSGVPYLDQVTFKISTDTDAAFMEVLSGAIDIFPYLTTDQAAQLEGIYNIEIGGMSLVQALFLNWNVEPFNDINVRQAICYALDRQFIIDMVAGGKGTVVESGMYPSFKKYYDSSLDTYYTQDIEKAKSLLADAGFPDGFSMTITLASNYKYHIDTAEVIVQQLAAIGITAKIQTVEWASWYSDVYKGEQYEATVIGLDANLAPSNIFRFYPSDSSNNFMNYSSTKFDAIFAKAVAAPDGDEKIAYYKELQRLLTEDVAAVYIQNPALIVAVDPELGGYTFYPVFVQEMSTVYYKGK